MSAVTASPGALPTRSLIETWDITHLEDAAARWRTSANESDELFDQHRQNIAAPGGTDWDGTAKDTALDRVTRDSSVVRAASDTVRAAAELASAGAGDLRAAQRSALEAISEAEANGFRVGEDLSVTDTRRLDISTIAARYTAATEHAENIRWNAEQLLATDTLIGRQITAKATELDAITFDGESGGHDGTIQLLTTKPAATAMPATPTGANAIPTANTGDGSATTTSSADPKAATAVVRTGSTATGPGGPSSIATWPAVAATGPSRTTPNGRST